MHLISETSSDGVIERTFAIDDVTGVLWSPESGPHGAPLVLMGHPGGLHKKARGLVARAHRAVTVDGYTVASIDAPGHGDRPRNAQDQHWVADMLEARAAGRPLGPILAEYNGSLAERAVPEWRAVIDELQALPEIGADAPIGYTGMTLASAIGLPLVAVEPRITAAIFGGVFMYPALIEAAKQVTIPIEFLLPWDDAEIPRQHGLDLFDAFASTEKVLHAFPGGHHEVPEYMGDNSGRLFARHLGRGVVPA
jgi:alpha-beta hydrolase superfamily lysophospholipase